MTFWVMKTKPVWDLVRTVQSWTGAKARQCFSVGSVTFKTWYYETIQVKNSGLPLKRSWQLLLCGALKADFSQSFNLCLGLISVFPMVVVTYRAGCVVAGIRCPLGPIWPLQWLTSIVGDCQVPWHGWVLLGGMKLALFPQFWLTDVTGSWMVSGESQM